MRTLCPRWMRPTASPRTLSAASAVLLALAFPCQAERVQLSISGTVVVPTVSQVSLAPDSSGATPASYSVERVALPNGKFILNVTYL